MTGFAWCRLRLRASCESLEIEYLSEVASDAMKGAPVGSLLLTYRYIDHVLVGLECGARHGDVGGGRGRVQVVFVWT